MKFNKELLIACLVGLVIFLLYGLHNPVERALQPHQLLVGEE